MKDGKSFEKIAFSENIKREDLNPIELGKMYKTYMDFLPKTIKKNSKNFRKSESKLHEEIAKEFNISVTAVRYYISLLVLPKELQDSIILNHGDKSKGIPVIRLPLFFFFLK